MSKNTPAEQKASEEWLKKTQLTEHENIAFDPPTNNFTQNKGLLKGKDPFHKQAKAEEWLVKSSENFDREETQRQANNAVKQAFGKKVPKLLLEQAAAIGANAFKKPSTGIKDQFKKAYNAFKSTVGIKSKKENSSRV